MAGKRKRSVPIMLFWSKSEQRRFIDAVERFAGMVNDLERILAPVKRRRAAKIDPNQAAANGTPPTANPKM